MNHKMSLYLGHSTLSCIFYAAFHPEAGIRLVCQSPQGFIDKPLFDIVQGYIIPKKQLHGNFIAFKAEKYHFLGFPASISSDRYPRNAFMFNLCLVFEQSTDTTQYESIVRKLSDYMVALEKECHYLSKALNEEPSTNCEEVTDGYTQQVHFHKYIMQYRILFFGFDCEDDVE